MNTELMFSSKTDQWATPQRFYDELNKEFKFTLDPCADVVNHKTDRYYTKDDNGLLKSWENEVVFCNPPYGRKTTSEWIKKCHDEHFAHNITICLLIPVRTDTKAFHDYIYNKAEIRFIKGRLKFGDSKNSAPFPSMVVVFKKREV